MSSLISNSIISIIGGGKLDRPDEYALANALKAAPLVSIHGRKIHAVVVKLGFCRFTILMTALMNFNLKCGNLDGATKVFDDMPDRDVVSWTSMIVGYTQHHRYKHSLDALRSMIAASVVPNGYSFSGALTACSRLQALSQGQQIHAFVLTSGALPVDTVVQNSLLHMYLRCHCIEHARNLFDSAMDKRNIIAWNDMMSGHLQCGQGDETLRLFALMASQAVKPDDFSYAICTDACASLPSMQQGSQIHACILKNGFQSDLVIVNALVNMYGKCGCIDSAKLVFDVSPSKDRLLWTTMISALSTNGKVKEVLALFEQMRTLNIKPDEVTYLVVLSACSHGSLVGHGCQYFRLMAEDSSITVSQEHYSCMVDLLCRSGYLLEAFGFIKQMPLKPGIRVWSTYLGFCRMHGNIELAQIAADQLLELDSKNLSQFVSLSNIYASECNWNETMKIRDLMKSNHIKKEPGCSWIELKSGLHVFLATVQSHYDINEILLTLNRLMNMCWIECCVE
ncbi:hypothetical protein IFM89_039690 [Coptis chinensis]|uniref:Pentatricopeptide repeat-containing protein n=1 Tax=Coptis chinensis TaxID=261450 RepID=A0A835GWD1_9MAGN|nr:hypothetical protein IFM89_039690 [Coptis chinensis]